MTFRNIYTSLTQKLESRNNKKNVMLNFITTENIHPLKTVK